MGFLVVVAPTAYLITGFFNRWIGAPWMLLIHVTIYIAIFYGVGVLVRRLVHLLPWRPVRLLVFTAVLLLPFFSSFARVLTYASLWGSGGTYTFWEAVHRYNAKRR